ncbi:MAG: ABC transporter permease subunit, partial [Coriobacteriia bacterium]
MTRRSDPETLVAVRATGALAFVLLTVVPLALLVAELAGSSAPGVSASLARRMGLLLATVRFSALAALSAVLVGSLAAMWAWVRPGRTLLRAAVVLSGLAIPVIAHVAAFRAMTDLTRALGMVQPSAAVSAWLVQALTLVPVAAAIVYAALRGVDTGAIDAARVQGGDTAAVLRVALPLAAPSLAAGFGLAFALSLAEHAVPSSFALDVYAMELYAEYSATGSA